MLRSVTLGSGNKSSFFDWLKNMGSIIDSKITDITSGTGGTSNQPSSGNDGNSQTGTNGIIKSEFFKESEYFPSCKPTDARRIGNYNRLIKSMDKIRSQWGSAILIVSGYECDNSEKMPAFDDCKAIMFKAQNGKNKSLYDAVGKLRDSGKIQAGKIANIAVVENPTEGDYVVVKFNVSGKSASPCGCQ